MFYQHVSCLAENLTEFCVDYGLQKREYPETITACNKLADVKREEICCPKWWRMQNKGKWGISLRDTMPVRVLKALNIPVVLRISRLKS